MASLARVMWLLASCVVVDTACTDEPLPTFCEKVSQKNEICDVDMLEDYFSLHALPSQSQSCSDLTEKQRCEIRCRLNAPCDELPANDSAATQNCIRACYPDVCPPVALPDAPPSEWSLDDVCSRWPVAVCARIKACCERDSSLPYKLCSCEGAVRNICLENVAAARARRVQFHPERVDACLSWVDDACAANPLGVDQRYLRCAPIFEGEVQPGGACDLSTECQQLEGEAARAFCGKLESAPESTVCLRAEIRQQGEACIGTTRLDFPTTVFGVCADGLYCKGPEDRAPGERNAPGTCEPFVTIGELCPDNGFYNDLVGQQYDQCAPPGGCEYSECVDTGLLLPGEACSSGDDCFYRICVGGVCVLRRLFCSHPDLVGLTF